MTTTNQTETDPGPFADIIGKWATINGVFCFVKEYEDDGEHEILTVQKGGRTYHLLSAEIDEVSA